MPPAKPDWSAIDTILLDMDGTILDLAYDNWFWQEHIPEQVARARGVELPTIRDALQAQFDAAFGSLNWYCLDHWTRTLELDIATHKQASRHRVRPLDGALPAIERARARGHAVWLVTNAHPLTLQIKLEQTGIAALFDALVSSHELDAPKEHAVFWERLQARLPHDPKRSLFVDDSLRVREAARRAGYPHVWAITRPDSRHPARTVDDGPAADRLADVLAG